MQWFPRWVHVGMPCWPHGQPGQRFGGIRRCSWLAGWVELWVRPVRSAVDGVGWVDGLEQGRAKVLVSLGVVGGSGLLLLLLAVVVSVMVAGFCGAGSSLSMLFCAPVWFSSRPPVSHVLHMLLVVLVSAR